MRFSRFFAAIGVATSMLATSCALEPVDIPQSELYARQFVKTFGVFDIKHDWNTAGKGSITVNCPSPSTVKIYAKTENGRYCFASFKGVQGQRTLEFDVPKGVNEYDVRVNGRLYAARENAMLDIAKLSVDATVGTGAPSVKCSQDDRHTKYFSINDITSYRRHLPERGNQSDEFNLGRVTQNFTFVGTQDFVIYPVYFNSSANVEFGIYYRTPDTTDPNDFSYYPICLAKGGKTYNGDAGYDFTTLEQITRDGSGYVQVGGNSPDDTFADDYMKEAGSKAFRSKGIVVDLVEGLNYGFYIQHHDGGEVFYSEAQFNEVITNTSNEVNEKWWYKDAAHFGVYETVDDFGNPRMVLGAEDWLNGDFDLNDFVVFVDKLNIDDNWPPFEYDDVDETGPDYEWVIACEDLGTLDDFDFNDVVFSVGPKTQEADGTYTVEITALAAGGTLPAYLYLGSPEKGYAIGGEWHSWFGEEDWSQMINTRALTHVGKKMKITVPENFTLSCCVDPDNGLSNMGGFHVVVDRTSVGGDLTKEIIAASHPDAANATSPQMLCLPYHWMWPIERTGIHGAYEGFTSWVSDKNTCTDWHKTYKNGTVIKRKISTGSSGSTSGSGSQGGGSNSGYSTGTPFYDPITTSWGQVSYERAYQFEINPAQLRNARKIEVRVTGTAFTSGDIYVRNVVDGNFNIMANISAPYTSAVFQYDATLTGESNDGTKLNLFKKGNGKMYVTLSGVSADFQDSDLQVKIFVTRTSGYDDSDVWEEIEAALNGGGGGGEDPENPDVPVVNEFEGYQMLSSTVWNYEYAKTAYTYTIPADMLEKDALVLKISVQPAGLVYSCGTNQYNATEIMGWKTGVNEVTLTAENLTALKNNNGLFYFKVENMAIADDVKVGIKAAE